MQGEVYSSEEIRENYKTVINDAFVISDAVRISMSIPLLFTPSTSQVKANGSKKRVFWRDGVDGGL